MQKCPLRRALSPSCMEDHAIQIALYIPSALEASVPHATSHFSALETLLARGNTTHSSRHADAQLLALFGGDPAEGTARAAVSHFAQTGTASEEWRIVASPVHLLADHTTLHFPPQHTVSLSGEESRALMMSCQDYFAEEGWQLDYGEANAWYLHVPHSTGITTTPLHDAVGKPLFEALPQGRDARLWRRWLNEAQMLFHGHAVNAERSSQGQPPINSLWFWGHGCLPALSVRRFNHVYGGDRFVQGLARLSGAPWSPLAAAEPLSELTMKDGPLLMVLDEAAQSRWDIDWFAPLHTLLRGKTITRAELHFHNGYSTHLSGAMLWRFWRRKRFSLAISKDPQ